MTMMSSRFFCTRRSGSENPGLSALVESAADTACDSAERRAAAAASLNCEARVLEEHAVTPALVAYQRRRNLPGAFGRTRQVSDLRVIDERGVVRLALRDATVVQIKVGELRSSVRDCVEAATRFGDVGRALPALYLLRGARIAAFEGLSSADQAVALATEETDGCAADEPVALLVVPRAA